MCEEIYTIIDNCKVMLLDCTGTLLMRPFLSSEGMYQYLEDVSSTPGFCNRRIKAEKEILKHTEKEDSALEQIYKSMGEEFKHLLGQELELLRKISIPNPRIKKYYDYAQSKGKSVILVSDSTIPKRCIEEILTEKEITGYNALFSSPNIDFREILDELSTDPEDVVYIGALTASLNKKLKKNKIRSYAIESNYETSVKHAGFIKKFKINNWWDSVLIASQCECIAKDRSYWNAWGYSIAGPICYSFTKWIYNNTKEHVDKQILFIARDGYLLQIIYDKLKSTFGKGCTSKYVYAPRSIWALTHVRDSGIVTEWDADALDGHYEDYSFKNGTEYAQIDEAIRERIEHELSEYAEYVKQLEIGESDTYMVDSITEPFTSQKLLEKYSGKRIEGLYWRVKASSSEYSYRKYQPKYRAELLSWNIMEFIMSSPDNTVHSISKNEAVFAIANKFELKREEIFKEIEQGALEYCTRIIESGLKEFYVTNEQITLWMNLYVTNPSKTDREHFNTIMFSKHSSNMNPEQLDPFRKTWSWKLRSLKYALTRRP